MKAISIGIDAKLLAEAVEKDESRRPLKEVAKALGLACANPLASPRGIC